MSEVGDESGGGTKSNAVENTTPPSIGAAKKLQPALSTSFSSNQLNSVKSVHNSHFDSSRSGSITSIMYAKSKYSSGYRLACFFFFDYKVFKV